MRKYLILAPGHFVANAKTAHGVIRYAQDVTVAVVDPDCSGARVCDVVPFLKSEAPIVASVDEGLRYGPTALLIGTAPKGGKLPAQWRAEISRAIGAGLEIVSGLHDFLQDDPQFAQAAASRGVKIWDVRRTPEIPLFSGQVYDVKAPIVLTVGNDCAVGKMTATIELERSARKTGVNAMFAPTGQTGVLIAGWGIVVDRAISDFVTGACEQIVLEAAGRGAEYVLVEGQGGINHPAYAPVTLGLLFGSAPDALILVADPSLRRVEAYNTPILSYLDLIAIHEGLCATVKPASVIGIALNTSGLDERQAEHEVARAREETGLPADDLVRNGADNFWREIAPAIRKREPLSVKVHA